MNQRTTRPKPLESPEVVLNLWAYAGEDGYVMRLAGKAYVMDGDDAEKLELLHKLACTDFLAAPWEKVPPNFKLTNPEGKQMTGIAHASMLSDAYGQGALFGPLIEALAKALPEQVRSVKGDYQSFRLELPQDPLTVMTVVMEYEDGRLVPMVSG